LSSASGPILCNIGDLERTGAKGVCVQTASGWVDVVVVRDGSDVRAFENRCPHLSIPLEVTPDRFLDADRQTLVCSMHGARFSVMDGYCISGPCRGGWLRSVTISVDGDAVRLVWDT